MRLTEVSTEIIVAILALCDPLDVAKIAQTCSAFRAVVYSVDSSDLWRQLYMAQQLLDDPRHCVPHDDTVEKIVNWRQDLQKIIRARTVITDISCLRPGELGDILKTLLKLSTTTRAYTTQEMIDPDEISLNLVWVATKLANGFLDCAQALIPTPSLYERQLLARLHTYFGITKGDEMPQSIASSQAFVYSLQNYHKENDYGPFRSNGTVDWEHIRAIHHIISAQIVDLTEFHEARYRIYPMSMPFTQIVVQHPTSALKHDWAGVEGLWKLSFGVCSPCAFWQYNNSASASIDSTILDSKFFREELRVIDVDLVVTRTDPNDDHPTRPIVSFYGRRKNSESPTLTGKIWMTPDYQVRWHFLLMEQATITYSCEGLHVGGQRCAYGILGCWKDLAVDMDRQAVGKGPFWLHKYIQGHGSLPAEY